MLTVKITDPKGNVLTSSHKTNNPDIAVGRALTKHFGESAGLYPDWPIAKNGDRTGTLEINGSKKNW